MTHTETCRIKRLTTQQDYKFNECLTNTQLVINHNLKTIDKITSSSQNSAIMYKKKLLRELQHNSG